MILTFIQTVVINEILELLVLSAQDVSSQKDILSEIKSLD